MHLCMHTPIYTIGVSIIQRFFFFFQPVSDKLVQKVIIHRGSSSPLTNTLKAKRVCKESNNLNS